MRSFLPLFFFFLSFGLHANQCSDVFGENQYADFLQERWQLSSPGFGPSFPGQSGFIESDDLVFPVEGNPLRVAPSGLGADNDFAYAIDPENKTTYTALRYAEWINNVAASLLGSGHFTTRITYFDTQGSKAKALAIGNEHARKYTHQELVTLNLDKTLPTLDFSLNDAVDFLEALTGVRVDLSKDLVEVNFGQGPRIALLIRDPMRVLRDLQNHVPMPYGSLDRTKRSAIDRVMSQWLSYQRPHEESTEQRILTASQGSLNTAETVELQRRLILLRPDSIWTSAFRRMRFWR